jgi:hypothetical protein
LEESLLTLRDGGAVPVGYETTFLINWPAHLGGDCVELPFEGTMFLVPILGTT